MDEQGKIANSSIKRAKIMDENSETSYLRMISTSPRRPSLIIWEGLPVEPRSMEGGTMKSTASRTTSTISLNRAGAG